jgi:uncharacterized protein YjiS (DUF1127 family)
MSSNFGPGAVFAGTDGISPIAGRVCEWMARAAGMSRAWWRAYREHRTRRSTAMLLRSLDDRTLADLGLDRSEIASAVSGSSQNGRRLRKRIVVISS